LGFYDWESNAYEKIPIFERFVMIPNSALQDIDPEWADVVMRILPEMYRQGEVTGNDDCLFVYATTFFAVEEELRRGAPGESVRQQASRILEYVDETDRPVHEKEHFAAIFARAVDDALEGRSPCVLH
jgi:hypothetical protein